MPEYLRSKMATRKPEWTRLLLDFLLYFVSMIIVAFETAVVSAFFVTPIFDGIKKAYGTKEQLSTANNIVLFLLMLLMQLLFFMGINFIVERKTKAISKVVEYCFGKNRLVGLFTVLATAYILSLFSYFAVILIQFSAL